MQEATSPQSPSRTTRPVFAIVERDNARSFFTRVGSAWSNRDGSITVRLDLLPFNGVIQIRDPEPSRAVSGGAQ